MITRLWRGWTSPADADTYEELLRSTIFPGILARRMPGFRGIELLRRRIEGEVEFVTIMWFDTIEPVRDFAGPDWETAVVPAAARAVLSRFDDKAQHFESRLQQSGCGGRLRPPFGCRAQASHKLEPAG